LQKILHDVFALRACECVLMRDYLNN